MTSKKTNSDAIDLDAFLESLYGEGRRIKLYGKIWTLKSDLPAGIRLALREDRELSADEETNLFKAILDPETQYDELVELGLGATAWDAILRISLGSYMDMSPEEVLEQFKDERLGKILEVKPLNNEDKLNNSDKKND